LSGATRGYSQLIALDADLVLPRQQQLDVANTLAGEQEYARAAETYEKYLKHYPTAEHHEQVRLMLGVIYAKYLSEYQRAEEHLTKCRVGLSDQRQVAQCDAWLATIAQELGRPAPETE
jgi:outer membrane protein assembly factor BamD (BamD/ComL family)